MGKQSFFQLDESGLEFLKSNWRELTGAYEADGAEIASGFGLLVKNYSEKGRVYHNLSHVRALMTLANSIRSQIADYDAVAFAIWFHDAVYNTRRRDNEERSAELAEVVLKKVGVPTRIVTLVSAMVLATKNHTPGIESEDLKLFLDLDLSILGAEPQIYREYSNAIRREYRWVPDFLYRRTRREILEGFMKRESLYFTAEMAERFESRARHNLAEEVAELSK